VVFKNEYEVCVVGWTIKNGVNANELA